MKLNSGMANQTFLLAKFPKVFEVSVRHSVTRSNGVLSLLGN